MRTTELLLTCSGPPTQYYYCSPPRRRLGPGRADEAGAAALPRRESSAQSVSWPASSPSRLLRLSMAAPRGHAMEVPKDGDEARAPRSGPPWNTRRARADLPCYRLETKKMHVVLPHDPPERTSAPSPPCHPRPGALAGPFLLRDTTECPSRAS
jgi:hypothetical protein